FGVATQTLMTLNGIRDRNMLQPGQELKLAEDSVEQSVALAQTPSLPVALVEPDEDLLAEQVDTEIGIDQAVADAPAIAADSPEAQREAAEQADKLLVSDPSDYSVAADNT